MKDNPSSYTNLVVANVGSLTETNAPCGPSKVASTLVKDNDVVLDEAQADNGDLRWASLESRVAHVLDTTSSSGGDRLVGIEDIVLFGHGKGGTTNLKGKGRVVELVLVPLETSVAWNEVRESKAAASIGNDGAIDLAVDLLDDRRRQVKNSRASINHEASREKFALWIRGQSSVAHRHLVESAGPEEGRKDRSPGDVAFKVIVIDLAKSVTSSTAIAGVAVGLPEGSGEVGLVDQTARGHGLEGSGPTALCTRAAAG